MSKSYYRVSFLSNSQRAKVCRKYLNNVKELLSCFLFKQFTTAAMGARDKDLMSKSYYRVSFLSNSQRQYYGSIIMAECQRAIIVFPF